MLIIGGLQEWVGGEACEILPKLAKTHALNEWRWARGVGCPADRALLDVDRPCSLTIPVIVMVCSEPLVCRISCAEEKSVRTWFDRLCL
jgi:hypothetical protein